MREPELFNVLERMAAAFPWEQVAIWTERQPAGSISFTAIAQGDKELGFSWNCEHGSTPEEAAEKLIKFTIRRDPEAAVKDQIAKLRAEIERLKGKQFALPPYRPTPFLGPPPETKRDPLPAGELTVNVESTVEKDDVPF